MSRYYIVAEERLAPSAYGATDLPLLGLTLGIDGAWSARLWQKSRPHVYERHWCESVRVVGDQLKMTYNDQLVARPDFRPELTRTISAWGPAIQAQLMRLRVGIVGAGSVGSMVAEALARMGVSRIRLLDFDSVEQVNLDRLLHATANDAR